MLQVFTYSIQWTAYTVNLLFRVPSLALHTILEQTAILAAIEDGKLFMIFASLYTFEERQTSNKHILCWLNLLLKILYRTSGDPDGNCKQHNFRKQANQLQTRSNKQTNQPRNHIRYHTMSFHAIPCHAIPCYPMHTSIHEYTNATATVNA